MSQEWYIGAGTRRQRAVGSRAAPLGRPLLLELPVRTQVYVDGFNLYYGALKDTPFKWLDPVKLAYQLLPAAYSVCKLKYFTARVSGIPDAGAPARQQAYLSALATLPEVEVIRGVLAYLQEMEEPTPGEVCQVFSESELRRLAADVCWLKASERSFEFWENQKDAVYDGL